MVLPLLAVSVFTPVLASPLENQELQGTSAAVSFDIKFGDDNVQFLPFEKTRVTPTLDAATLDFYCDTIDLSDSEIRVNSTGNNFRISNQDLGILIYGHFNDGSETYRVNIYFAGDEGFVKHTVATAFHIEQDTIILDGEIITEEETVELGPDLVMAIQSDQFVYLRDYYDISLKVFDAKKNSDPDYYDFFGTLDDVNISVAIRHESEPDNVMVLEGVTAKNGFWESNQYFVENLSLPGNYIVAVTAQNQDIVISENLQFYLLNDYVFQGGDGCPAGTTKQPDGTCA